MSELHDLTDVYGVLALLDIVIGFLSSSGGSSETLLDHYVHTTIGMPNESSLVSPKIQQFCQLKHVLALWRLLTVEKGRRLALADRVNIYTVCLHLSCVSAIDFGYFAGAV